MKNAALSEAKPLIGFFREGATLSAEFADAVRWVVKFAEYSPRYRQLAHMATQNFVQHANKNEFSALFRLMHEAAGKHDQVHIQRNYEKLLAGTK